MLDELSSTGLVWDEVRSMKKIQTERHAANFQALFLASQNASLFLPNKGRYETPPIFPLIKNARNFVGELNIRRKAIRSSTLFGVATPECAHGLGCTDWLMHCRNVKHISEQYLLRRLGKHHLTGEMLAYLSILRIALLMYTHDVPEDNRKTDPTITPAFVAKTVLSLTLEEPYASYLLPILTADIEALTDDPDLHGRERLMAQKIPPQIEYATLRRMGILKRNSEVTGPIGTGKFVDKCHTLTSDFLIVATGHKSFFKDAGAFAGYIVPRLDIVKSLHVPAAYKSLFEETAERTFKRILKPHPAPMSQENSRNLVHTELARIEKILSGEMPHIPVSKKAYSIITCTGQACP